MATQQEKQLELELLKQVPEFSHQTGSLYVSQHIGTLIFTQSAFLRIVMLAVLILCKCMRKP